MTRPADWHVLDLAEDPTPGDPHVVGRLGRAWTELADEVERAERGVRSVAGDGAVLQWIGAAGDVFRGAVEAFPDDLAKCKDSYRLGASALGRWAQDLQACQAQADRALAQGRVARAEVESASAALGTALGASAAADRDLDRLQVLEGAAVGSGPGGLVAPPDPQQVRAAVRTAQVTQARVDAARSRLGDAQSRLDAARRLALDARDTREERGRAVARAIDDAASAGIPPASFWDGLKQAAARAWDDLVTVAKVVVVVLGVVALIIGGPIAWVVLAAAVLVLADTLWKYANDEASGWDVLWATLGCIPGIRGLTSLSAIRTAFRSGGALGAVGHVLSAGRAALVDMARGVRALVGLAAAGGRRAVEVTRSLARTDFAYGDAGQLDIGKYMGRNPQRPPGYRAPEYVWRAGREPLYRADNRPPEVVFAEGFRPKNPDMNDLDLFVRSSIPSNFVSTSTRADFYQEWTGAYRYIVDAPGGIDVNATLPAPPFPKEQEIAFPGGIPHHQIVGAHPILPDGRLGEWIPNPHYRGPA